jgi:hypothetical protein
MRRALGDVEFGLIYFLTSKLEVLWKEAPKRVIAL